MFGWGEYPVVFCGLAGLLCLAASIHQRRAGKERRVLALAASGVAATLLFGALLLVHLARELISAIHTFGLH